MKNDPVRSWAALSLHGASPHAAAKVMRCSPKFAEKMMGIAGERVEEEVRQRDKAVATAREDVVGDLKGSSWPLEDMIRFGTVQIGPDSNIERVGHLPGLSTNDRCPQLVGSQDRVSRHCWER